MRRNERMRTPLVRRDGAEGRHAAGRLVLSAALATLALAALPAVLSLSAGAASAAQANPAPEPSWAPSGPGFDQHQGANGEHDVNVCSTAVAQGTARCLARVRTDFGAGIGHSAAKGGATVGVNGAYPPSYLQAAYNMTALSAANGAGQTVAIVDAYDDPNALADVTQYRSQYSLPALSTTCGSGPCFTKVNEQGQSSPLPSADSGWSLEISLDLDMVSAMCPNCNIDLVEASSASYVDLGTA